MTARGPGSSTNPFRKSLTNPSQSAAAPLSPETAASIFDSPKQPPRPHSILHTNRSPSVGQSRGKKVRVQSPPSSGQSSRSSSPLGRAHEIEFKEELEELEKNEAWPIKLHAAGGEPSSDRNGHLHSADGSLDEAESDSAPYQSPGPPPNPFSRTLQDMEQSRGRTTSTGPQETAKPINVDAFKRLLLTGVAAPADEPQDKSNQQRSSSDTAPSETKPVALMSPPPVPAPRKSKPPPPPPSRQSRYSRPESRDLGKPGVPDASPGKSLRDIQKPPPPLPSSRRNSDTPESDISPSTTTPTKSPLPGKQSKSDTPKPLPPVAPISEDGTSSSSESIAPERRASMESIHSRAESIRSPQTPAPAPPPPRRQSNRRSVALAPEIAIPPRNPSPAPSIGPADSEKSPVLLSPVMLSPGTGLPGSASPLSQRSMESIRSAANLASLAATGSGAQKGMPPLPPPPPPARSSTMRMARPSSRHEGGVNRENLPPPPPPPPARRGANRGSVDNGPKKLGAGVDGNRQRSVVEGEGVAEDASGQGPNILADIEALQREVDAFRESSQG